VQAKAAHEAKIIVDFIQIDRFVHLRILILRSYLRGGDLTQQEQFMSSKVISLFRCQSQRAHDRGALLHGFAKTRRYPNDVFWLKENAELLNILECSASTLDGDELNAHEKKSTIICLNVWRFFRSITGFLPRSRSILRG